MGPRVKFHVDPEASLMMDKQLISNDVPAGKEKLQWMVFGLGNESWDLIGHGKKSADWWDKVLKLCPKDQGRHLIFRSNDESSDVYIKYIPDDATVKERTYFSSAADSLFDDTRGAKNKFEIRSHDDLLNAKTEIPGLAKFLP